MNNKFSNYFIGFLIVVNVLPILAPIFLHWGWELPSRIIYFLYSFACHQIHWRSLHIHDHQCAWCTRDMAIWTGVLLVAILARIFKIKGIKWYQMLPFIVPIGLDGGIQTIASLFSPNSVGPAYVSTNFMRAVTGGIFGVGLGALLAPLVYEYDYKLKVSRIWQGIKVNIWKVIGLGFATVMALYLTFVGIWHLTSSEITPELPLDLTVRLPEPTGKEIPRRQTAVCPVTISPAQGADQNFIATDCFF